MAAPGHPREVLTSDDPPLTGVAEVLPGGPHIGLIYPEWDYRMGVYHEHGAVDHERTPPLGDALWAEGVLARRAALLHEVRRRFERLRPRRHRAAR